MEIVQYDFKVIGDERGSLVAIEELKNIPFEIKRVYYIYNVMDSLPRGFHAHKELKQVLICMNGSCKVLLDDGKQKEEVLIDKPNKGLLVDTMVWHEMYEFSSDCILMVLASDYYDESDYIREYSTFIQTVNEKN